MGDLILHDLLYVLSAIFEYKVCAAWVVVEERCDVVNLGAYCHVAGLGSVV
jgi:hypothetical protein